jgi:di/tricarboxylate transporter
MSLQQAIVLGSILVLVVELGRGKRSPGVVFAACAFLYLVLGYVPMKDVLGHFANSGLVTVMLLLLVSIAVDKSRLLDLGADALLRGTYRWATLKLTLAVASYSALLNNTAVVASLIGPLRASQRHPPGRLLLPMCYAATIGGVLTLVGTSTNLLVSSFMIASGRPGLKMFDPLPVGIFIVASTVTAMVLTYPWLMRRADNRDAVQDDYFLEARVRAGSGLVGKSVQDNGLRHLGYLFLSEIIRDDRVIAPVEPDEVIVAGDKLVFAGDVGRLDLLAGFDGLEMYGQRHGLPLDNLVEVVVLGGSSIARRTVRDVDFRSQFDAAVVAIRRGDARVGGSLGSTVIEVGDVLILAVGKDFDKRNNLSRNFIVVSRPSVAKFIDPRKGIAVVVGFAAVIAGSALGWFDFLTGLVALLAGYLLLGYTNVGELRRNVPYELYFIIGSALVISAVMTTSGVAEMISSVVLGAFAPFGDRGAIAAVLLLTWVLTELMSNNAAAALAYPVAAGVIDSTGIHATPLVMAVLFGASCSFMTPYGYQTNLMVMAPGKYTVGDYARAGAPVAITYLITAWVAIPIFFPLR